MAHDLRDSLLNLIRSKFYAESGDDAICFAQDEKRLLAWVILWPAGWLNGRGVTLSAERYKKIFTDIILDAVRFGNTSKVRYRPAWLKHVMQTHFAIHGEEYYTEAKNARAQAEHALLMLGKLQVRPEADPVRELAAAGALLARSKPAKRPRVKETANLEFKL
ncbi:MAG TPA: hypothetical protein VGY56_10475 [Verrucomicrobiae bacterium]|nr:hypothetical protein [Verrucomicrobiae bacterium]